jgi:hypothetical protein
MQHLRVQLVQHMQHLDKTLATYVLNSWNIWNIHLQHTCTVIATYTILDLLLQHPDKIYATFIWNAWNIQLQHVLIYLLHHNRGSFTRSSTPARSSRSPTVDRWIDHGTTGGMRRGRGCATWSAGASTSVSSFGARHKARGHVMWGTRAGASVPSRKDGHPKSIIIIFLYIRIYKPVHGYAFLLWVKNPNRYHYYKKDFFCNASFFRAAQSKTASTNASQNEPSLQMHL